MSNITDPQTIWEEIIRQSFDRLRVALEKKYTLEGDGSGSELFVSIRKALDALPCVVKILEIEFDEIPKNLESNKCALLHYDLAHLGALKVMYFGKAKMFDDKFAQILRNEFHVESPENVKLFNENSVITATMSQDLVENYQFVSYDVSENTNEFLRKFIDLFDDNFLPRLAKNHPQKIDFNKIYNLESDVILPESELVKRNSGMDLGRNKHGGMMTIEDMQSDIALFQLIPAVEEHTKKVFERAKKLYIFGYYVYDFFPISHHYAVLSLEVAIRNRYYTHFGFDVTIRNQLGKETKMHRVDYDNLDSFCKENRKDGWNLNYLCINGQQFRKTMNDILEWMIKEQILTIWETKRCKIHLKNRNYLSHQTFSPIYPWGTPKNSMSEVAYLINRIFSSPTSNKIKH